MVQICGEGSSVAELSSRASGKLPGLSGGISFGFEMNTPFL